MHPRACLKRAWKLPLAEQVLTPAIQSRLEDRLEISAVQTSMPRSAQLHTARPRTRGHGICERNGLCKHLQNPTSLAISYYGSRSSSGNSAGLLLRIELQHPWARDPSHVLAGPGFMQRLVPWRSRAASRRTEPSLKGNNQNMISHRRHRNANKHNHTVDRPLQLT